MLPDLIPLLKDVSVLETCESKCSGGRWNTPALDPDIPAAGGLRPSPEKPDAPLPPGRRKASLSPNSLVF